jgi:hypothetical protein
MRATDVGGSREAGIITSEPKLSPVIPEAERSEAIRDLHQRVELTRSRIGALLAQALASRRPG